MAINPTDIMNYKALLDYLKRLEKNNNKEWFDTNKKEYESLRKEWVECIGGLIADIGAFDADILGLEPKSCIFRINRDVRFSADKSPYKTNFGASMSKGGKKLEFCGYYFQVRPNDVFIAGGCYMPASDKLANIRQEIDYNLDEFRAIINHKEYKKQFGALSGETLSRPPKGYEADNPAVEYLKHKSFLSFKKLDDSALFEKNFEKEIIKTFKAMKPLNDFLNRAIVA